MRKDGTGQKEEGKENKSRLRALGLFNKQTIAKMKNAAYLVNNARGSIVDAEAVKEACESAQLSGYGGDVCSQQPPPRDHPWLLMPDHAMTPYFSGTARNVQAMYAAGTKETLEQYFEGEKLSEQYLIVGGRKLAGQYA